MAHQVPWNKIIVEEFIRDAMLSEEEEMIVRARACNWSRQKQSTEYNMSLSTIDRITHRLKIKYDNVEKTNPLLPPRKFSSDETWKSNK